MTTDKSATQDHYAHLASSYDRAARRLKLIGFQDERYRMEVIAALDLHAGATVVELGCGTGANHAAVIDRIGALGTLIAVDLTPAMLERAQARASAHGWANIELVQSDVETFEVPTGVDAVFSTFAFTFMPDCGGVVRRACRALKPGGRFAAADQKVPGLGEAVTIPAYAIAVRSFGITREMMARRPWKAVRAAMADELEDLVWSERYLGFTYVAHGRRPAA